MAWARGDVGRQDELCGDWEGCLSWESGELEMRREFSTSWAILGKQLPVSPSPFPPL